MSTDSVRLALPGEAASIAAIQRRGWEQTQPTIADQLLRSLDLAAMTQAWVHAIVRPPLAEYRVLVAVAGDRVVGFAAVGPSDDPDADAGFPEAPKDLARLVDADRRRDAQGDLLRDVHGRSSPEKLRRMASIRSVRTPGRCPMRG